MPTLFILRRPSQRSAASRTADHSVQQQTELDASPSNAMDGLTNPFDLSPLFSDQDPEVESVRSHPSSHADQSLLPHPAPAPVRSQTQRLQRRRYQQYYISASSVLEENAAAHSPYSSRDAQQDDHHHRPAELPRPKSSPHPPQEHYSNHKRVKSYSTGGANSWLLLGSSNVEARRQSWTRETRKLQKDPRPSGGVEISDGDGGGGGGDAVQAGGGGGGGGGGESEMVGLSRGSMLGVRRKMERLKGLYRNRDKEVVVVPR